MYKPLPDNLRLGFSDIHDIGLFAKEDIPMGTNFGMSHLQFGKNIIRTPDPSQPLNYKKWNLITLRDIKEGEELTLKYTFYKV